jgi:hypothetical protein
MENSANILNELVTISPMIAGIEKRNVFTVPAGYFENLGAAVLMNVNAEMASLPPATEPLMQVPQGYFESLAGNILNRIKAENNPATELKELSPMLYSIQNEHVFTVPQGYFESLPASILAKVKPQQARVVSMQKRTVATILKYAIAAVFTGVMALGVYKFANPGAGKVPPVAAVPQYVKDGQHIKNVDEELAKIPDEDIIKYLQADGTNIDAALVANKMEEAELPSQEDYLSDDKALDKFLDNVDLNDLKN